MNLVERLRELAKVSANMHSRKPQDQLEWGAADRIEDLEKAVATFRKAYSKQKRQKCALRVELQQQVDELETALKEAIEWDWMSDTHDLPQYVIEQVEAALKENNDE